MFMHDFAFSLVIFQYSLFYIGIALVFSHFFFFLTILLLLKFILRACRICTFTFINSEKATEATCTHSTVNRIEHHCLKMQNTQQETKW